jgi:hypothetical protein
MIVSYWFGQDLDYEYESFINLVICQIDGSVIVECSYLTFYQFILGIFYVFFITLSTLFFKYS